MDLCEAWIAEKRSPLKGAPDRRCVRLLRVGRQIEDIPVSACRKNHGVAEVSFRFAGDKISRDNPSRPPVDYDQVEHLAPRVKAHLSLIDLPAKRRMGSKKKLLPGLTAAVKHPPHLPPADRPVS